MRKLITGTIPLLSLCCFLPVTASAAGLQAVWDKGISILDLLALIAGGLFVIAVALILFAVLTEKKPSAKQETAFPQTPEPIPPVQEERDALPEEDEDEDEPEALDADGDEPVPNDEDAEPEEAPEEPEPAQEDEESDFPVKPDLSFELTLTGVNNTDSFAVLLDRPIHLGRKADNDIVLADSIISGKHAVLLRENDRVFIEDRNSTNGTYINTVRVRGKAELVDGDTLQLGERRYKISF